MKKEDKMKKIFVFLLIILLTHSIFAKIKFIKVNEIKLEKEKNSEFDIIRTYFSIDYNIDTKQLYLPVVMKNKQRFHSQFKSTGIDKNFYTIKIYNGKGKIKGTLGTPNSYAKDGIIYPASLKIVDSTTQIYDMTRNRLLVFSDKNNFLYEIIPDYGKPLFSYNGKVYEEQALSFTTKNKKIDLKDFYVGGIAKLENDNKYDYIKHSILTQKIVYVKKYFDNFFGDNMIFYNKSLKKRIAKLTKNNISKTFALNILVESSYINVRYLLLPNKTYIASSNFGTDFMIFDKKDSIIDSFTINYFTKLRNEEIMIFKNYMKKDYKFHKKRRFNYNFSSLVNMFYEPKQNNLILYYILGERLAKLKKLKREQIIIYSLDKKETISNNIDIDFTPIKYDPYSKTLIALKQENKDVYLVFYKLEI